MCSITGSVQPSPSNDPALFLDKILVYPSGNPCNLSISTWLTVLTIPSL